MIKIDPDIAQKCKAWPFEEAKAVIKRLRAINKGEIKASNKGHVLFQTGYGPSGLPHIGTFQEVARTSMVMQAFNILEPGIPTKIICFSDDMDGLRKVPDNIPNPELLQQNIDKPLSDIPNPFDTDHESFSHHNNSKLQEFLDFFEFDYTFYSSTQCYKSGKFDEALLTMLQNYEDVKNAVLPLLGEERRATYSPFLPISPLSGKVLQVPILETNTDAGTIVFEDEDGSKQEVPVTGGHVKCQWRPDWALRWYALDVDYEMSGTDLRTSADIAGKIVQIMGGRKPAGFHYELFLDEKGEKISKSKGNGLSIEEWLTYAPHESLSYYIYQRPTSGKKLYFDVIPKAVDEYITSVQKLPELEDNKKIENAGWYIHKGSIPSAELTPVSFALLLNLASAANANSKEILWGYIQKDMPNISPETSPFLDRLIEFAIKYYEDFVLPQKKYRSPDEREKAALEDLVVRLQNIASNSSAEEYMSEVFSAGKENGFAKEELREWFEALYQILLGENQGPRFGSFISLYGVKETIKLIEDALEGKFLEK